MLPVEQGEDNYFIKIYLSKLYSCFTFAKLLRFHIECMCSSRAIRLDRVGQTEIQCFLTVKNSYVCHCFCHWLKAMAMAPPFKAVTNDLTEQTRINISEMEKGMYVRAMFM